MRKQVFSIVLIFWGVLLFQSCDKNRVYDQYKALPGQWNKDSRLTFKLGELDSLQKYNLFINVRNSNAYPYSNLFLIAEIQFPQGKVLTDTLEYEMAKPDGTWLGHGFGEVKESKLWYKQQVQFREAGTYKVKLKQAMRENGKVSGIQSLQGITDVGFRIEKYTQQP